MALAQSGIVRAADGPDVDMTAAIKLGAALGGASTQHAAAAHDAEAVARDAPAGLERAWL